MPARWKKTHPQRPPRLSSCHRLYCRQGHNDTAAPHTAQHCSAIPYCGAVQYRQAPQLLGSASCETRLAARGRAAPPRPPKNWVAQAGIIPRLGMAVCLGSVWGASKPLARPLARGASPNSRAHAAAPRHLAPRSCGILLLLPAPRLPPLPAQQHCEALPPTGPHPTTQPPGLSPATATN